MPNSSKGYLPLSTREQLSYGLIMSFLATYSLKPQQPAICPVITVQGSASRITCALSFLRKLLMRHHALEEGHLVCTCSESQCSTLSFFKQLSTLKNPTLSMQYLSQPTGLWLISILKGSHNLVSQNLFGHGDLKPSSVKKRKGSCENGENLP